MTLSSRKSGHLLVAGLGFLFDPLAAMTVNPMFIKQFII